MFDPAEKEQILYHMGYLGVSPAAAITFGLPAPVQTLFLVQSAIERVLPHSEDRIRQHVKILDDIECKMQGGQDFLVVNRVDSTEIREDHIDKLEDEYCRWASRLSDILGAPLYPGSAKFRRLFGVGGSNMAGSIPVRG